MDHATAAIRVAIDEIESLSDLREPGAGEKTRDWAGFFKALAELFVLIAPLFMVPEKEEK
jgi:hypothetical protein